MTDAAPSDRLARIGRVHFLGLAGVGVSAVARVMQAQGVPISGTDAKDLPVLDEFRTSGVPVRVGYRSENITSVEQEAGGRIDTVIASSVAQAGNPEYDEAVRRGVRVLHRSEGLAAVMDARRGVAVAGTHGKTTTSSMTATLLDAAGLRPGFAVGASVAGLGTNASAGEGEWFVAEADESDGSLLNYRPEIAVITNVEADHLDHHGTPEAVHRVFVDFTARILDGGTLILCLDDEGARELLADVADDLAARSVGVMTYGRSPEAALRLTDDPEPGRRIPDGAAQTFGIEEDGRSVRASLSVPGGHNALNALASVAVGRRTGLSLEDSAVAVGAFRGVARRFDLQGEAAGVRVYDDYAHHPTEVAALLTAAREAVDPGSRVHVIFQPHLFSRTQEFAAEFSAALRTADTVAVLEIYPARERPVEGVTAALIADPLFAGDQPPLGGLQDREEAVRTVVGAAAPGDLVLTVGAGDVTALGPRLVEALSAEGSR
ncbi:MAG: UDP-N-acetylmuramate--L-alanine ligase [Nesterenkonia sp.]|nr:UDP-N-acetylmuramate--L-alanine ligase [Nesterenkonia sp.]